MIEEIVNFIDALPEDAFQLNLPLGEGLYIFVGQDEAGNLVETSRKWYKKGEETDQQLEWCRQIQYLSAPVSSAKIFDANKKIFGLSCSAFALVFKRKNTEKSSDDVINKSLDLYFQSARVHVKDETHIAWAEAFADYCQKNIIHFVRNDENFFSTKPDDRIHFLFTEPDLSAYQAVYDDYVGQKVFNSEKYNTKTEDGRTLGVSDALSSYSEKKQFWQHMSAPFLYGKRIDKDNAIKVWRFFEIRKRILPNPLPIFIDKRELNGKVVRLYNEDEKIGYAQILRQLFENHQKDLGGYYLLFFEKGEIADIDFVSAFRYSLDEMYIHEVFDLGERQAAQIKDIFEFELKIANKMLDDQLIYGNKGWLRYFCDIEAKNMSDHTYTQLLKYRKSFYDFIYKSKREAIQAYAFHDIMRTGIIDLIRRDEGKDSKTNNHEYKIKEKLNIWFSLYHYFDSPPSNDMYMVNKTQQLTNRMRELAADGSEEVLHNDDEFAFASGQLIRYLLSQSESGNRSHALLEPFLQKTDPNLFKLAIARAFDTYKHAFKIYGGGKRYIFDKLMALVMGYEATADTNMKDHLPMILAGYFADSVFRKEQNEESVEETINA